MRFLKKAGLEVHVGILKEKCLSLNDAYNKFITTNIPFVIAKVAVTLDGKIATQNGDSKWITNAACREYVHRLRSSVDAVMIGGGTVRRDDPRLTVRLENFRGRQPIAIVVDDCLKISRDSRVFKTRNRRVIACTTVKATKSRIRQAEKSGVEIIRCRSNSNGLVFLPHMLSLLGKAGVTSILLEGGGSLFADFMRRGLLDKLVVCISPKLIGAGGMDFLPGISIGRMKDAIGIGHVEIKTINDNVVIEGNMR
jgi:diaminohydroxyphosphoribosylaminopyrimidine deaminase/5-amino-6-(5-phosphoribosylamino)uracil reductase